jgi:hypothetical protein
MSVRRWRAYQLEADRMREALGIFILFWRRQSGKTEELSTWSLEDLLKIAGRTVILASASLNVGGEVALRAATVFWDVLERMRQRFKKADSIKRLDTGTENKFDALAEAFMGGKLQVSFTHPGGKISRLKVIAPNPATARGFTGSVFLDEIGFIPDFRAVWDAVEPITSSDPDFRLVMSTTPPPDSGHYSHELLVPPADLGELAPNAGGHWYRGDGGIMVHRVDALDAALAGAKLYHPEKRTELTVAEHRALALDKEAWDRNYGLKLAATGTAACSLSVLHFAQSRPEAQQCHAFENDLPADWRTLLGLGDQPVSIGYDSATTEKGTSNPSSISIVPHVGRDYPVRLIFRWKTADPAKARAILREILSGVKCRRLSIDATNERYFAVDVRREFSRLCPIELVVASERITYQGAEILVKTYLGNLVVNALDEGQLPLPVDRWVREDFRLVRRVKGGFDSDVDGSGNHGDTFDSTKLALHGWMTPLAGAFTAETLQLVRMGPARPGMPLIGRPSLTPLPR